MAITLEAKQGLPFEYVVTVNDSDGVPIDLVGSHIVMKIRETLVSEVVLAELSTDNSRITFTATAGQFKLFLEGSVTETLVNGVFDIVLTTATGEVYLIGEGSKVKVKQIVSR